MNLDDIAAAMAEEPRGRKPDFYEPPSAWLRKRQKHFGGSDIGSLMVALGRRSPDLWSKSSWTLRKAKPITVDEFGRYPRLFFVKAGIIPPLKRSKPAARGLALEHELLRQWRHMVHRRTAGAHVEQLDIVASTIRHIDAVDLPEAWPWIDRECFRHAVTLDAVCRSLWGELITADMKCSVHPYDRRLPEHIALQKQSQMACTTAELGLIVEGEGWGADWKDHAGKPSGPVVTWIVERDDRVISDIRGACEEGWEIVEKLRAMKPEIERAA